MTNCPCATQWAVHIGSARINLASAALLVGHTNKRSSQLGHAVQFVVELYDVAMSSNLKLERFSTLYITNNIIHIIMVKITL